MIVDAATAQTAQSFGSQASPQQSGSSDFTTFLKLLTAQLRNQDPLKPLDSTEFVAQLATFSSVEQQVKTNDTLATIQQLLGGANASGLASWVGAEVRVLKTAEFAGSPIEIFATPNPNADNARLLVKNAADETVQTLDLPLIEDVYQWAGVDNSGAPLADGKYSFVVESYKDGAVLETHQGSIYDEVREARLEAGKIILVFADGTKMLADEVSAIRKPTPV